MIYMFKSKHYSQCVNKKKILATENWKEIEKYLFSHFVM